MTGVSKLKNLHLSSFVERARAKEASGTGLSAHVINIRTLLSDTEVEETSMDKAAAYNKGLQVIAETKKAIFSGPLDGEIGYLKKTLSPSLENSVGMKLLETMNSMFADIDRALLPGNDEDGSFFGQPMPSSPGTARLGMEADKIKQQLVKVLTKLKKDSPTEEKANKKFKSNQFVGDVQILATKLQKLIQEIPEEYQSVEKMVAETIVELQNTMGKGDTEKVDRLVKTYEGIVESYSRDSPATEMLYRQECMTMLEMFQRELGVDSEKLPDDVQKAMSEQGDKKDIDEDDKSSTASAPAKTPTPLPSEARETPPKPPTRTQKDLRIPRASYTPPPPTDYDTSSVTSSDYDSESMASTEYELPRRPERYTPYPEYRPTEFRVPLAPQEPKIQYQVPIAASDQSDVDMGDYEIPLKQETKPSGFGEFKLPRYSPSRPSEEAPPAKKAKISTDDASTQTSSIPEINISEPEISLSDDEDEEEPYDFITKDVRADWARKLSFSEDSSNPLAPKKPIPIPSYLAMEERNKQNPDDMRTRSFKEEKRPPYMGDPAMQWTATRSQKAAESPEPEIEIPPYQSPHPQVDLPEHLAQKKTGLSFEIKEEEKPPSPSIVFSAKDLAPYRTSSTKLIDAAQKLEERRQMEKNLASFKPQRPEAGEAWQTTPAGRYQSGSLSTTAIKPEDSPTRGADGSDPSKYTGVQNDDGTWEEVPVPQDRYSSPSLSTTAVKQENTAKAGAVGTDFTKYQGERLEDESGKTAGGWETVEPPEQLVRSPNLSTTAVQPKAPGETSPKPRSASSPSLDSIPEEIDEESS